MEVKKGKGKKQIRRKEERKEGEIWEGNREGKKMMENDDNTRTKGGSVLKTMIYY